MSTWFLEERYASPSWLQAYKMAPEIEPQAPGAAPLQQEGTGYTGSHTRVHKADGEAVCSEARCCED